VLRSYLLLTPHSDPAFWEPYFNKAMAIIEQKSLPILNSSTLRLEYIKSHDMEVNNLGFLFSGEQRARKVLID